MARGKRARIEQPRSRLQRIIEREAMETQAAPLVNDFAFSHGDYGQLGKLNDARHALINRGGTPVARWTHAKLLSDSQQAAIAHCVRLWSMINGRSLVAVLDKIPGSNHGDGYNEQYALSELASMKAYIPSKYWGVFESVCRFDEPAGYAGSRLTDCTNDQTATARVVVQFVADIIAMNERLSY